MKKNLMIASMFLVLGVSGYGEDDNSGTTVKTVKVTSEKSLEKTEVESGWWHEIGDADSDYWWVAEYADE